MTRKWKRRFKRKKLKLVVSPGDCTDLNTSVVDCHIGKYLKDFIREQIKQIHEADPVLNNKIEKSGISCLRVQITHWVATAWKQLCQTDAIEKAFKKCGLANDIHGKENDKIEVLDLLTYSPPDKDFVPRKEPYSEKEQWDLYNKEFDAFQENRKRKLKNKQNQSKRKRAKFSFI